jgi:hypothetical protein
LNYFGLAGSDSYKDYDLLKTIINNNHIVIDPINSIVAGWPLLHLLSSFVSIITQIDPLIIAKFLPSFLESIIAISVYLLVHYIYKNEKAALLSCLIVGTIPKFMSFESLFVRESYALYFFIFFFYLLYAAKQKNDYRLLGLSIFLIPIIVLSHHFTVFMLIILLFIFIVFSAIIPFLFRKKTNIEFNKINIFTFFIILLTVALFYWSYFTPYLMKNFFQIYFEAIGVKELISYGQHIGIGQTVVTLRGNILLYGFFLFQGILSFILLLAIFLKKQKHKIENVTFTVFLFFCLFLGGLSLFVLGSIIFPDRFLPFGWLLGSIPLSVLVFTLKKSKVKKFILFIIVCFLVFNIYNIEPDYYTGGGLFDGRASEKEYAIAGTINITKPYYGYVGVGDAIYDLQRFDFMNGGMKNPITTYDLYTRRWYTFTTKQANCPPVFDVPSPLNGSRGNSLSFSWSIPISDPEGDLFSWTIQCSNGQVSSGSGASNGKKSLVLAELAYSTTYNIWVNATDPTGSGLYTRRWYTFTKLPNCPPVFVDSVYSPSPENGSTGNEVALNWTIGIEDLERNNFSWTIQCSNGQKNSGYGRVNGIKSFITLRGLTHETTYKVWVNATDPGGSGLYTRKWYTFMTKTSYRPFFEKLFTANGSTNTPLSFSWDILIKDPQVDQFSWTIQCSNEQTNSGMGALNGIKSLVLSNLTYSTTYKVWVNSTGNGFFKYSNLAIIYKDLYLNFLETERIKSLQSYLRITAILSYEDFQDINKICDVGDVYILTWA